MLELRMTTDMQAATPAEIGFNFEELKAELAERLDHYNGLVVTEDGIKDAKADRAKLNKLRTAIDTRRKDIKKEYLRPYNEFESKVKEITLLIDRPIRAIDTQLADFEERRKEAKLAQIEDLYHEAVPEDLQGIIPLQRILDQRWLNATTAMAKVEEGIHAWVQRVNADLLALDTVEPEYQAAVREKYISTLDVTAAIKHRDALKAAQAAFEAREAERIAQEEKRAAEAAQKPQEAPQPQEPRVTEITEPEPEKLYSLRLEFSLTRGQALALRNFLDNENIKYKKI